jgi:hypothetical protein
LIIVLIHVLSPVFAKRSVGGGRDEVFPPFEGPLK